MTILLAPQAVIEEMAKRYFDDTHTINGPPRNPAPYENGIKAALRAAKDMGWVLVPVKYTEKMYEAGDTAFENGYIEEMWKAMLAAANGEG